MNRTRHCLASLAVVGGLMITSLSSFARGDDRPVIPDPPAGHRPFVPATSPATQPTTAPAVAGDAGKNRPEIEVAFVLDTTGSMGGLIEGAKQKIWSIANTIIAVNDKPRIKIALVAYRDRGDRYITQVFDLTDDIDTVFKNLTAFQADGGGDTPESVNQALNEAVTKLAWSEKPGVTRIMFLVGDAPPHMDYKDDVKFPETCALAVKKGITIDAVQCGNVGGTAEVWQQIAKLGKGAYIPLAQEGGMVVMATPVDKELAELNARVAGTVVCYGEVAQQQAAAMKVAAQGPATQPAAEPLTVARFADRAAYNSRDGGKAIQGHGDLVWDCNNGVVDLAKLKVTELPPELQKMSPDERKAYIDKRVKEREALQKQIVELTAKRDAFVAAERTRLIKEHKGDSFDEKVSAAVRDARK